MFTFGNFSKTSEDENNEGNNEDNNVPSEEIKLNSVNTPASNTCHFMINDIDILYYDPKSVINDLVKTDSTIMEAEKKNSDLVEGVYEGGLKIWECTYDIAHYLCTQKKILPSGKQVLDLGCGSGILGILAYKLDATEVHFQDYNDGVIRHLTVPNIAVNCKEMLNKSRFWCGDWGSFRTINDTKYDIILTSETIYNPKNQKKLLMTLKNLLKPNGLVILGAKSYYFGVGGSMKQFLDHIDKDDTMRYSSVWQSAAGVKTEVIEISFK